VSTREERETEAMRIGGGIVRQSVGDQAKALLISGRWLEGEWRLVSAFQGSTPTHWIEPGGAAVRIKAVQGVRYPPGRLQAYNDALADVVGRERCDLSGEEIDEEYVHNGDELAYCPGCESSDVLTIDGGSLTYAEHDRRGRPLSA
jgi:hypothetical protein